MTSKKPRSARPPKTHVTRSRNAGATRAAFLKEGETLFAQFGFEGVSLELIARSVGANKTLISYHFKTKRGLYVAVISKLVSDVMYSVSERLNRTDDAIETFGNYVESLVFSFAEKPAFCAILMREYIGSAMPDREDAFQHVIRLFRLTNELYRSGLKQSKFKELDPHLLHFSIVGPIIHFIVSIQFRDETLEKIAPEIANPSLKDFVDHHKRMILDGLRIDA